LHAANSVPGHDIACWNPVVNPPSRNPIADDADKNPAEG
jgi:hypothetical protein